MPEDWVNGPARAPEAHAWHEAVPHARAPSSTPRTYVCPPPSWTRSRPPGCQAPLGQTAQQTATLVRERPSSTRGSYPADRAERRSWLRRGKDCNRAGGTCQSKGLADRVCQRAELLTEHLRKGVKQSWENTLPANFQTAIPFSEIKRLYKGSAWIFVTCFLKAVWAGVSGFRRFQVAAAPKGFLDRGVASLPSSDNQHFLGKGCL